MQHLPAGYAFRKNRINKYPKELIELAIEQPQGMMMQYDPKECNILVPTTSLQQVSPWHAARASTVQISPDPNSGDVFKVGSRYVGSQNGTSKYTDLFSPAKPSLMRIAAAAGIVWNWRDSGATALQKNYVCYRMVGAMRLPDGTWQPVLGTKEIDLDVIEEEAMEANLKKALEMAGSTNEKERARLGGIAPEEWARRQTRSSLIQWRKNKLARAETGAMLRVIRAALGLKSQYTAEELKKPFVVPRIDFSPDYNDPLVRQMLVANGAAAMAGLFGQSAPQAALNQPVMRPALEAPAEDFGFPPGGEEDLDPDTGDEFGNPEPVFPPEGASGDAEIPLICDDCKVDITQKVYDFSLQHYGRCLCVACQKKQGSGGGGR
jgi:hypothetical protein